MNILTFDIEDWFHILDNESTKSESQWMHLESRIEKSTEKILNLLEENNQHATFFCLGWVARKYPHLLKEIYNKGHEIASHSDMHQLLYEFNPKEFKEDLKRSIESIEDVTGGKVKVYRAPGFSLMQQNQWIFEELIEQGIEIDCSVFPVKRAHGGFEKFGTAEPAIIEVSGKKIKEFPINTYSVFGKQIVFSGGGYFRLFPYFMIDYFMRRSPYVMTYLHPRDFDPNQPMIEGLNMIRKFKSYVGIKGALTKLQEVLNNYDFVDLQTANSLVDWNQSKVIKL